MAIDRWFIGGGAEHTPESARRLVYAATGGVEGVVGAGDLRVVPLAVPGGGVRVLTGSGLIRSQYVGGDTQTYMGTVYEQETVSIGATGSGAGRSDLVVMRVEDPFAAGSPWDTPATVETAPYIHIRVISGVSPSVRRVREVPGHENDTAIALARIDLPASTGTVTAAHIVNLRENPTPRTARTLQRVNAPAENSDFTSATATHWPVVGIPVEVPEWATHAFISGDLSGLVAVNAASSGDLWLRLGTIDTQVTVYNEQAGFGGRLSFPLGAEIAIPSEIRGTTQQIRPYAKRNGGTGILRSYWGTALQVDVQWIERA